MMRNILDRALTVFIYTWIGLFFLANVIGIVGQFYLHGFGAGVSYVQEIYGPFNAVNYLFMAVTLSPAIGAYYWREHVRRKQEVRR